MKRYDVIVVGSGVAGLSFALKVASQGYQVAILTKKTRAESNTNYAQGGIASVTSSTDDFNLHIQDTFRAGDGLCHEDVVRAIVGDGPDAIQELIRVGVSFSQLDDGRVSLHREGGHSKRRILHVHDITGKAIEEAFLSAVAAAPNIDLHEHYMAIDLITRQRLLRRGHQVPPGHDQVLGLYALDTINNVVETFCASAVMLATGGIGQVYQYTTNPDIATGDGIAMAWRAGVPIRNMEFVQFHPTALYTHTNERFLISEAVRGEGAILRNLDGEAFMKRYDERGELASRDIVARAIDSEMKTKGVSHVWLDITHKGEDILRERFPSIFENCLQHGINIGKDYIPVVPAAHYLCGGIVTDLDAGTSLCGLYACGEAACTGLHGANRLASNSLLEAVVLANRGSRAVVDFLKDYSDPRIPLPEWEAGVAQSSDEKVVLLHNWDELKRTMWDYVGIVRTNKRLARAQTRIKNLSHEIQEYYWKVNVDEQMLELRNMIRVADLIVQSALYRHESRGLHYTLDFPDKWDFAHDTTLRRGGVF
ncbi:MAG: L-aspartate oxidase [Opitutales bacterium]|nr:L-aspartate oxidase [Opitutales bacterium]